MRLLTGIFIGLIVCFMVIVDLPTSSQQDDVKRQTSPQTHVQPPVVIHAPDPAYPPMARQARVEGEVSIRATIGADGLVENVELQSGHPLLVQAALDAVKQWQFKPAMKDGQGIAAQISVVVNFKLPEDSDAKPHTNASGTAQQLGSKPSNSPPSLKGYYLGQTFSEAVAFTPGAAKRQEQCTKKMEKGKRDDECRRLVDASDPGKQSALVKLLPESDIVLNFKHTRITRVRVFFYQSYQYLVASLGERFGAPVSEERTPLPTGGDRLTTLWTMPTYTIRATTSSGGVMVTLYDFEEWTAQRLEDSRKISPLD